MSHLALGQVSLYRQINVNERKVVIKPNIIYSWKFFNKTKLTLRYKLKARLMKI